MKRNLFSLASAAAFVLAVVFAGCTREEVKDGDGQHAVSVSINLGESRAATTTTPATSPTFTTGWILFTSGAGTVVAVQEIGGSTGTPIADLKSPNTKTFTVPATASAVHVFGTVGGVTAWPTTLLGASISSLTGTVVTVADLFDSGDATKIPLYGSASITPDASGGPNDYLASSTVSVIAGRVEIKSIAMAYDATTVNGFKVKNIFVNYFYPSQDFLASKTAITNGLSVPTNYVANTAPYTTAGVLYDVVGTASADLPSSQPTKEAVVPSNPNDRWAYNLLAPATGATYFPHFIIEISDIDVVGTSGDDNYDTYEDGSPTFYLTVKGVASQTGTALNFTKSNVYQIEEVLFSLSDLSTIPEPSDKSVKCQVTVSPWVTQTVTPIL